ncbi:tetratricopeptide repeat protein [Streptomyces sp. NPDC093984]|uniref:tetratricopeptide repeat protein n=1 Tax=Streptomyces sp. NPDC093984 TaxID=3366052 RepID=UPI00380C141E
MTDSVVPGNGGPQATGARSVAVGGGVGVAITGDGTQVVMLPAEAVRWAKEIDAPPGAGDLPGSASGVFVGRQDELAELRRLLADEGEAAVTQVSGTRAIHGLGGIGKSTLALRYAHTYRRSYTLVWWINAASTQQIVTSLAALAGRLCPQWAATAGVQERAAWAILWLQWHPGWLLVFDNAEDPADLRHYLGALPDGHHLATSRTATGWHAIAPTMPLGLLDAGAAVTLLCTLAFGPEHAPTPKQREDAAALTVDLGYLPLALEQAGAYLFETGTSMADYREMLGQVMDAAAGGIDPERTIARIWRHTLTAIERRNPQAVTLLDAMAWLAPDDIPRSLLAPLCPDPLTLGQALGALFAYNMVAYSADRQSVSVHRLVQNVLRQRPTVEAKGYPPGRRDAEHLIQLAVPDKDTDNPQWERLLPHILAFVESSPTDYKATSEITQVYQEASRYLDQQGRDAHSVGLRQAILDHRVRSLGDAHPNTLASRNNLGAAYQAAGNLKQAIPLLETTLTNCEQVLGKTHHGTLITRNNLAVAYQTAGNYTCAIPLFEAALAHSEQALGDTHPDTLTSRNNLGRAYQEVGHFKRAIPLFEATLTQREEILGNTHPDTLTSRNNLGRAYQKTGHLQQAIPLLETTLTQREEILGDTHPDTLTSRGDLAVAYGAAGDYKRAIPLLKTTLTQREEILGNTHPDTLTSRNDLAHAYEVVGDLKRATLLFETTLTQREQALGETHPSTLTSRNNLAYAYRAAGDLKRAIPLFETTLTQREEVLGETHPDTLVSRINLAGACHAIGDLERAILLLEFAVSCCEQTLGETHPYTLTSRNNLAGAYRAAGDLARAIPLYEATLAQREQILGDTHPDTLTSRNSLASAYRAAQAVQQRSTATSTPKTDPQSPPTAIDQPITPQ